MAKGKKRPNQRPQAEPHAAEAAKSGHSLKEMLDENALDKLKQLERKMREEQERRAREAAEARRREQEERERNKSFAELLEEYEKKGGGKYG